MMNTKVMLKDGADEELFEQLYLDLETYYKEEVLEKQEPHLSNILDDIELNQAVSKQDEIKMIGA